MEALHSQQSLLHSTHLNRRLFMVVVSLLLKQRREMVIPVGDATTVKAEGATRYANRIVAAPNAFLIRPQLFCYYYYY
jgi:hypothetical protein